MLIHMAFFLIMVMVLNQLLLKPLLRVMDARKDRVAGNREVAERAGLEAKNMKDKFTLEIDGARKDSVTLRERIRQEGEAEEDKIIKAAREKSGDLVAEVREKIAAEFKEAQAGLRAESSKLGREIAARVLGRAV